MKFSSSSARLLTAFALSACGSGGGGSGPNFGVTPLPPGTRVIPITTNHIKVNSSNYNYLARGASRFSTSGGAANFLTILDHHRGRNETLEIIPAGLSSGNFLIMRDGNGISRYVDGGQSFTHTRFGYIRGESNEGYMMAHGTSAANIPHTGTATYNGKVVHAEEASGQIMDGTIRLNANFGNNSINGSINVPTRPIIDLEAASINGSHFNNHLSGSRVYYQGTFYGPNAEEVGGIYYKEGHFNGAFGAKR